MSRALEHVEFDETNDADFAYCATVGDEVWHVRVNESVGEAASYTLFVDGVAEEELTAWPSIWTRSTGGEPHSAEKEVGEPRGKLQTIYLRQPGVRVGDYDLDAVAIEYDPDADRFDFRLELGSGLGIYWALPAAPNDRLRLFHVDGAAYDVEEPELVADPFICDVDLEWSGTLAELARGKTEEELVSVTIRATSKPAAYRCEIGTYWRKAETFWEPRDLRGEVVLRWRDP